MHERGDGAACSRRFFANLGHDDDDDEGGGQDSLNISVIISNTQNRERETLETNVRERLTEGDLQKLCCLLLLLPGWLAAPRTSESREIEGAVITARGGDGGGGGGGYRVSAPNTRGTSIPIYCM